MKEDYDVLKAEWAKRRAAVKKRYRELRSLEAVGREFDISRQRVHKIITNGNGKAKT